MTEIRIEGNICIDVTHVEPTAEFVRRVIKQIREASGELPPLLAAWEAHEEAIRQHNERIEAIRASAKAGDGQ
jgi:DNA repair ATPase RecN